MKKIIALVTALTLVLSVPMVSNASEVDAMSPTSYRIQIRKRSTGSVYVQDTFEVGKSYMFAIEDYTSQVMDYPIQIDMTINLRQLLSTEQINMIMNADSVVATGSWTVDTYTDPGPNNLVWTASKLKINSYSNMQAKSVNKEIGSATPYVFEFNHDCGAKLYGQELESAYYYMSLAIDPYEYNGNYVQFYDITQELSSFEIAFTLTGIDGGTAQIITKLDGVNDKLDGVNDRLDGIDDSINQGFDGILTPDQGDINRNDQIAGDLADNKQEVDDIIGAMDSVEKPDADDAFELADPEQIVDFEDEAVQEMTGIIASVTGNSVVKNYLLLLFGVALVSFIFFGKKGG